MQSLYPAIMGAAVVIFIFALNHIITFISTRRSKNKTNLENRLIALYSSLYLQFRIQASSDSSFNLDAISLDMRGPGYNFDEIDKLVLNHSLYASNDLIEKWTEFVLYRNNNNLAHDLAMTVVK